MKVQIGPNEQPKLKANLFQQTSIMSCQNFAKVFTLCVGYFSVSLNRTIKFNKRVKYQNLAASTILLNTMTS